MHFEPRNQRPLIYLPPVLPFLFEPLPLGAIKPLGWLKSQLELSASGLAGHEHDFYRFVKDSPWLGGSEEYSKLNEAFPYWFNGLVPLAYQLDDERLKTQIYESVAHVIGAQFEDGWIGPEADPAARNFWGRMPFLLGCVQLLEADASYEPTILPAMHKYVGLVNKMLKNNYTGYLYQPGDVIPEFDHSWGRVRVQDMLISLQWLMENDPQDQMEIIKENMDYLIDARMPWDDWYQDGVYFKQDISTLPQSVWDPFYPYEHGVNVGQGRDAVLSLDGTVEFAWLTDGCRRP